MSIKINIKNMVCNRCIKVVTQELIANNFDFVRVDLGSVYFDSLLTKDRIEELNIILKRDGFEIVEQTNQKLINQIKVIIIEVIHREKEKPLNQNFSEYITNQLKMDYTNLSKLFSEIESKTIEQYIIEQRIEKAKELITYNELTLSQISYELDYSSPQHLSKQFKQITGLTPTQFKKIGRRKELDTI